MKNKPQTEMELGVNFIPPKLVEVIDWGFLHGLPVHECEKFHSYYSSNGWKVGRNPMKSWRDAANLWRLKWRENFKNGKFSVYELTKIIEAKQKMADYWKRKSSETASGRVWEKPEYKATYAELMKQIREMNEKLAGM
jgi:hypothetical protein